MKYSIDQMLTDSRPDNVNTTGTFVAATLSKIATDQTSETFERVLRSTRATKQGFVRMKFTRLRNYYHALPRLAAIALLIGSTSTVGAASYVAYRWITPRVQIQNIKQNSEGRKQYTLDSQCGAYRSGKTLQYEVARGSALTDADALKVFQNTCGYDALASFAGAHYISDNDHTSFAQKKIGDTVTIYNFANVFAGSTGNNPIFGLTIGNITALNDTAITIELPLYKIDASPSGEQLVIYYPNGKLVSRTVKLASDTQVWMNGRPLTLSDLHIGDTVQLVTRTRNTVKYYADVKKNELGPQISFDVAGIIKTEIDPAYVDNIGNPAMVNAIASLNPCYGNPGYECVSANNMAFDLVYAVESDSGKNIRYLRKDASKINPYQLDGRVTKIEGTKITLQARGSKHQEFIVVLPYAALANYNKTHKLKFQVGDLVQVSYAQKPHQNHLKIEPGDLQFIGLVEVTQPDGSVTKY
jgi:hypothetical protein